ncbi:unnamed protein product [Allacma fusca]|uniref:Inositol-pentakisphosphate 2-kinase n=1 Tax=Allacma fusca TaxID=39272 RepID=A0A8J2JYU5_9HEXA|nr:unnamed protein product [Allacma fusca]
MELSADYEVNYDCMIQWDSSNVHFEYLTLPSGCWRYRGEGNANIVIALKDEATIIRLSKNYSGVSWSEHHKKKVERQVVFTTHVFAPLLGKYFVAKVRAVYVSPEQIQQLNECLQRIRPSHRMHKELKVPYAAAHSDFARTLKFSSEDVDYCVEIKPKKGWWIKLHGMGDSRPNLCNYCLNQYQKLKKSKISSRSNYCPLDLFSGNPARIVEAVISLLANPQNNLRIFRDGRLVYSDVNKSDVYNSLEAVINEWMSSSSHQLPTTTSGIGPLKNFVYLICLALLKPHMESTDADSGINRFFQLKNELEELIISHSMVEQNDLLSLKLNEKKFKESNRKCCNLESSELPLGSVLSRILNAQKLEDSDGTYIRKVFHAMNALTQNASLLKAGWMKCL